MHRHYLGRYLSCDIVPFACVPRHRAPEGRGCVCFTPVPSMGPGTRWVPSHRPENRTLVSQTPTPSKLIFPNKRHRMTVTSSLYPGKVHSTNRKQKSDLSPGWRPASLRPPECLLLSPAHHQAVRAPDHCPGSAQALGVTKGALKLRV